MGDTTCKRSAVDVESWMNDNDVCFMHLSIISPTVWGGAGNPWEIDIKGWYLGRDFDIFPMSQEREFDRVAYV